MKKENIDEMWRCDIMTAHGADGLIVQSKAHARCFEDDGLSIVLTKKDFGCVMFEPRPPQ